MVWPILAGQWLSNAAVGSLIVLALGGLAVRLCRQPVRRSRLVVMTIIGALLAPWISVMGLPIPFRLPVVPWWASGVPTRLERGATQSPTSVSIAISTRTDPGPRPLASEAVGSPAYPNQANAKRTDTRTGPWTSTILSNLAALPWVRIVLVAYASTSTGLLAWWVLGHAVLWRVTRAAGPVSRAVRQQFLAISGPVGTRVRLLESDRIALPFTFTWVRPVILMPSALCARGDEEALKYALAHEWSHIEHRDAWTWNLTALAGLVLFYQPLYWWLRRQLRLCQDYLADDRAAAIGSPEEYAACLVRLARLPIRPCVAALPAMGIYDQPSDLSRRVNMLIEDREPIEQRCPTSWSLAAAATTALAILFVSGLRADSIPATDEPEPQAPKAEPREVKAEPKGETLHYSGKVTDKDTGKPIAGATVVVRRSCPDPKNGLNRIVAETRHTTNAEGGYAFTISPEQVAERRLYIEFDVEHPDYAAQAKVGYGLALIRKEQAKGQRPFFENIRLRPAKPVLGRVESPEGKPMEAVEIVAYSLTRKVQAGPREHASFTRVKTDRNGRFRVPVTTPGLGVFWIVSKDYAPEMHAIPEGQRGELGTFQLKKGLSMKGRAFDTQGKPLAGLLVRIERDRETSPDTPFLEQLGVSDRVERSAETDPAGRFAFDPLPAGVYLVQPVADQHVTGNGWIHRPLPGVFAPQKVTLRQGGTPDPLEIRMSPHVVIEGGWIDSKGKPRGGSELMISGYVDGQSWHTMIHPSAEGKFSAQVPHGIEHAQVHLSLGSFASTRYRVGKEGKLVAGQYIMFGTLDHDVRELQIVRYDETGVIVKATAKDGRPIKDIILAGEYTGEIAMARGMIGLKNGTSTEVLFERQADGRFRADDITPDRELKITADADGFRPVSRTFKIPEGKTEEVTFVLEAK